MIKSVSTQEFKNILQNNRNTVVLDVRTKLECRTECLDTAFIHIPLHEIDGSKLKNEFSKKIGENPVYILCRSGGRAMKAAEEIAPYVDGDVFVIDGGMIGCAAENIPTNKQNTISLERQVRVAAGAMIFLGVVMGATLSPALYMICAVIGAGLFFAGITDKCGMALVLARAPWNNKEPDVEIQKSMKKFQERKAS